MITVGEDIKQRKTGQKRPKQRPRGKHKDGQAGTQNQ